MSVLTIYERAPIGALVRYRDSTPQPSEEDTEAFAAWKMSVSFKNTAPTASCSILPQTWLMLVAGSKRAVTSTSVHKKFAPMKSARTSSKGG